MIDRAIGNDEWMYAFGHMEVEYKMPFVSDHAPMMITFKRVEPSGKIPFMFFNVWADHEDFLPLVEGDWKKQLHSDPIKDIYTRRENVVRKTEKWSLIEESILQQKSRAKWIKLGDSNSKYFLVFMKERRHKKVIAELANAYGDRLTDQYQIQEEIIAFYKSLMGSAAV
ncbi:uncharacterized protein [Nicotiana tomentosiformis]|uniref:uncharacterized protein n=1 Tax=Nicotiana tomentosiformis TaxID=4098 RepID=UPI00388C5910